MMRKINVLKHLTLICLYFSVSFNVTYWAIAKYDVYSNLHAVGDAESYINMSHGDFEGVGRPYCYRVLMPAVVSFLNDNFEPVDFLSRYYDDVERKMIQLNFGLVNIFILTFMGFLFHVFCLELGFSDWEAVTGVLLFFTSFFTVNYYTVPLVDSMACFFVLVSVYAIWRGSLFWLALGFLLGMLTKESTLVVLLIILLDKRALIPHRLLACLPGLVLYFSLVVMFPVSVGQSIFTIMSDPVQLSDSVFRGLSEVNLYTFIENTQMYMFLWVLFFYGLLSVDIHPFIKSKLWLLVLPFVVPFFVKSAAVSRVGFYLFPFVIPVALSGLRKIFLLSQKYQTIGN